MEKNTIEKFRFAVERTLAHEGGYANDPRDPGGETNFGISRRSYPQLDIKNLKREDAERIYRCDWWEKFGYDSISDRFIAAKAFDLAVNLGPRQAHKLLQSAVRETTALAIAVDGVLGDGTVKAVNDHPHPEFLLAALKLLAVGHYLAIGNPRFLTGWIRRAIE